MRGVPSVLLAEVRYAFQVCSRQHAATRRTRFSTCQPLLKKKSPKSKKNDLPIQVIHNQKLQAQKQRDDVPTPSPEQVPTGTELVPSSEEETALDTGRKVEVPLKVIPKAELTPNLTLSPKERLQIEQLTRRMPPRPEPKVWLAGFVPFVFINWTLRPMVTEVFLRLPQTAQHSPKAAMEFAKSLPIDATLEMRFMRATCLTDVVSPRLAHTRPVKSFLRPATFEWFGPLVEHGHFLRPNPTQFYVRPESATGMAARDVTPGIWSKVYERLTGTESGTLAKWRR
ncbi:hypothetical protein LTR10_019411 [Elasticomyces elasticus]|uniref:Letm1 RBD domain-containing protein n=1 Tax=Exophiala sideris TaxID=1016849 RepID=A0ABR0J2T4_9EURO|nr:hypothetical protein LTR10_019411 [Elasticomyces elasticus]KAK5024110.1 hypothetical protein LTS07_008845 [Exophiala sideris]KAK5054822.1 hypothetical protein LTR69_008730 [Exophiala sideris]